MNKLNENKLPLNDNIGQMVHQMTMTQTGECIDTDDYIPVITTSSGEEVIVDQEEASIKKYIKEAISPQSFIQTFKQNAHEALLKLCALQDNKNPLKKGGPGIAYRTDALIFNCKMELTAEENIVFDVILGMMSSFPDNETYRIEPATFMEYSRYKNDRTLYDVFKRGADRLENRRLKFDGLGPDGKDTITIPWNDGCHYHKAGNGEVAYIEFAPTDFFKALCLCSGIIHGAHSSIEVELQLKGKYTFALYWFLESRKNYRQYPGATPGRFSMSLEELRHQFSLPPKYKKADIERRALEPAKESINSIGECDFEWDYAPKYDKKRHVGYDFIVKSKKYIEERPPKKSITEEGSTDNLQVQVKKIAEMLEISEFSDEDYFEIAKCAEREKKEIKEIMQSILAFKERMSRQDAEEIADKRAYLCKMIMEGTNKKPQGTTSSTRENNNFNRFPQNTYDFETLEEELLGYQ